MSITEMLNSLKKAMSGLVSLLKKTASAISRAIGSLLDDSPIGWGYREDDFTERFKW